MSLFSARKVPKGSARGKPFCFLAARNLPGGRHAGERCVPSIKESQCRRLQACGTLQKPLFPLPRAIYPGVGTQAKVASLKYRKTRGIPYVPIQRAQSPQGAYTRQTFFSPRAIYPGLPAAFFLLPRAIYLRVGTQAKVASLEYRKTRGIPYAPIQRAQSPRASARSKV